MKTRLLLRGAIVTLLLVPASLIVAEPNENLAITLHVGPVAPERSCGVALESCGSIMASVTDIGHYDFLVVLSGIGDIQVLEYGLSWPPDWVFEGFVSCSDLVATNGSAAIGTLGITQGWGDSPTRTEGDPVIIGWLRLLATSPGLVRLVGHPRTGTAAAADPRGTVDEIGSLGSAGIGGPQGTLVCR